MIETIQNEKIEIVNILENVINDYDLSDFQIMLVDGLITQLEM